MCMARQLLRKKVAMHMPLAYSVSSYCRFVLNKFVIYILNKREKERAIRVGVDLSVNPTPSPPSFFPPARRKTAKDKINMRSLWSLVPFPLPFLSSPLSSCSGFSFPLFFVHLVRIAFFLSLSHSLSLHSRCSLSPLYSTHSPPSDSILLSFIHQFISNNNHSPLSTLPFHSSQSSYTTRYPDSPCNPFSSYARIFLFRTYTHIIPRLHTLFFTH